jgi:hypothetical protein
MITVEQLIEQLKQHDPKLPVMMPGYEGGVYDGPTKFQVANVALGVNDEWYYGPHEIVYDDDQIKSTIKALVIR